jgi:hypothetical protein
MEILKESRFIERLQFFNGQRLFAPDLQGLEAFGREMRWLHNKSLHQPGIGNGFAVSGKKADREVTIGPGYGIDREGREIVLLETRVEPVPPVAGEDDGTPFVYYLTVQYQDGELEESELREGICDQRGVVRLKEEPVFCWVKLDDFGQPEDTAIKQEILTGMRLVLARAEVLNCQLNKDVSIAERLRARPASQPYVCCADYVPDWKPWLVAPLKLDGIFPDDLEDTRAINLVELRFVPIVLPIGLTVVVNTTDCGFLTTPCYSARIVGPRVRNFTLPLPTTPVLTINRGGGVELNFIFDGFVQISDPKPHEFTATILLLGQLLVTGKEDLAVLNALAQQAITQLRLLDTSSPDFAGKLKDLTDKLFSYSVDPATGKESGWKLVWMGVED